MDQVLYHTDPDQKISTITLNRPDKLNAISMPMLEELIKSLERASEDESRVVILRASGRVFCCGADLGQVQKRSAKEWREIVEKYLIPLRQIHGMKKPVICQIQGDAVGGGFGLSLACDLRVMAEGARLRVPFVDIGIGGGDMGVGYFLPRLCGLGRAKEWMMTGRFISAEEALAAGVANSVEKKEDLEQSVLELAKTLAKKSPHAMAWTKDAANLSLDADLDEELNFEIFAQVQCLQSEDVKEGVSAFLEKREPRFKGC